MVEKILLAIEAMSEVDEMAAAADKHGYHLRGRCQWVVAMSSLNASVGVR